jgi:hypothetical protein
VELARAVPAGAQGHLEDRQLARGEQLLRALEARRGLELAEGAARLGAHEPRGLSLGQAESLREAVQREVVVGLRVVVGDRADQRLAPRARPPLRLARLERRALRLVDHL